MALWLRALPDLAEDLSSVPITLARWLTATYNSTFKGVFNVSDLHETETQMHMHTDKHAHT